MMERLCCRSSASSALASSTFSNDISSETTGPIQIELHVEPLWDGGILYCSLSLGHLTKMAPMPIYGKNPLKIFLSRTKKHGTLKLDIWCLWHKAYQVCSNDDPKLTIDLFNRKVKLTFLYIYMGKILKSQFFEDLWKLMYHIWHRYFDLCFKVTWIHIFKGLLLCNPWANGKCISYKPPGVGGTKVNSTGSSLLTKMVPMLIYGKNP